MSRNVKVKFSVQSMVIMKNTLNQMNIAFNEVNEDQVEVSRKYHNVVFKTNTDTSCDDMDTVFVNSVAQNYTLNAYKDRAIREGTTLREERLANGQIVLTRV